MEIKRAPLFGSVDKVPKTIADFKAWLIYKYPKTKFNLDITKEDYEILRNNQIKIEEASSDK
jgi:hypothetical protein